MKNSYITAGITLPRFIRLLHKNPFSLRPDFSGRILFILQASFWSYIFSCIEKRKFSTQIDSSPLPEDIIFIVGHWRTGSTFLHQLIFQDPSLTAPTLFQVVMPENYISSRKYFYPIIKLFITKYRPMDRVTVTLDDPQEDEYAIFRETGYSPLEKLVFPESEKYFLSGMNSFLPEPSELLQWEEDVIRIFKKIHFATGKRIISKNPFHSLRIPELCKMFPKAKFIHIYRHPYEVVPSSIHLWKIVQKQNRLNGKCAVPTTEEVADVLDLFLNTIRKDLQEIPHDRWCEVRFESLEKDPLNEVKKIYKHLGMDFTNECQDRMEAFLDTVKNYRRNEYHLTSEEKQIISERLKNNMNYYHFLT
ncbi:MAG: sulfotransferase [Bacteroidota bacterium]|nr:sulfotransferase [Bacteroidota bacterium]